jgi:hypothetical protein
MNETLRFILNIAGWIVAAILTTISIVCLQADDIRGHNIANFLLIAFVVVAGIFDYATCR